MKTLPHVAKVLLALFVIVSATEILLRSAESKLSGNIAHVLEITEQSERFEQTDEPGLLFLGNSLSNNGIDATVLGSGLDAQGINFPIIEKIVPDATTIWSWSCILRNRIYTLENKPDTIFMGFAWNQLADQSRLLPTQLGGFFCSYSDLMHISEQTTMSSGQIGEFLTASTFRLFTHREAIRNKVLGILIPHYFDATQMINRRLRTSNGTENRQILTYNELNLVIDQLQSLDKDIVLIALPVRNTLYEIDPELLTTVENKEITLLDYRNLDLKTDEHYLDEMHLNRDGSAILTQRLVDDFARIYRNSQ
jgi:hypothetical protein